MEQEHKNKSINLSAYGLSVEDGKGWQTILELQEELGGDIVATLDYPLPPGLARVEAEERMRKSIKNAVNAALYLREKSDYQPFLYVAAHGQDRVSMGSTVSAQFDGLRYSISHSCEVQCISSASILKITNETSFN